MTNPFDTTGDHVPELDAISGHAGSASWLPVGSKGRHRCDDTAVLVLRALEGLPDPDTIEAVRHQLGDCWPCVQKLDLEVRFKVVMAQRATDKAPISLQLRITETLKRVDLGEIDVTDL
jgi:hypothetical protein